MFWEPIPELDLQLQDQASDLIRLVCQKLLLIKCHIKMTKSRDAITFALNVFLSSALPKTFVYSTWKLLKCSLSLMFRFFGSRGGVISFDEVVTKIYRKSTYHLWSDDVFWCCFYSLSWEFFFPENLTTRVFSTVTYETKSIGCGFIHHAVWYKS